MTTDARPDRVFLSYSSKDKPWADAACAMLESKGVCCWVAPRDIAPGTEWGASIISGIEACRVMVLIFSDNANQSPQVRREVERAVSKGMVIMPCRVEDVQPAGALEYALSNTHWLDVFTPPVEAQLQQLVEAVQVVLASQQPAASSQNRPGKKVNATVPPVAPAAKKKGWLPWLGLGIAGVILAVPFFMKWRSDQNAEREFQERAAKAARARLVLSCEEKLVIKVKKGDIERIQVPPITIKIERIECRGEVKLRVVDWFDTFERVLRVPDSQSVVRWKLSDIKPPKNGVYVLRVEGILWVSQYPYPDVKGQVDIRVEVMEAP